MARPKPICARISRASALLLRSSFPVDRETGRPRGFAFVEFLERPIAEEAITRFNQQPFMGRSLSVSEARPREARRRCGRIPARAAAPGGPAASAARRPGGGFSGPGRGGGFGGPRPGGFGGPASGAPAWPGKNFGPPKKKSASSEKRWENKERGPKGPIKERYTGRLGGLYDDPNDAAACRLTDFDDPAARKAEDDDEEVAGSAMATHVKVIAALFLLFGGLLPAALAFFAPLLLSALAGFVGATRRGGRRRRRHDPRPHRRRAQRRSCCCSRFPTSPAAWDCSSFAAGRASSASSSRRIALVELSVRHRVRRLRAGHSVQEGHRGAVHFVGDEPAAGRAAAADAPADRLSRREAERVEARRRRSASTSGRRRSRRRCRADRRRRTTPALPGTNATTDRKPARPRSLTSVHVAAAVLVTATLSTASVSFA